MSGVIHRGDDLFANADWSKVVPAGSPEAAFLLVVDGGTVQREYLDLYRTVAPDAVAADTAGERTVRIGAEKPEGAAAVKPTGDDTVAEKPAEAIEVAEGETGELVDEGDAGGALPQVVNLDDLDRDQLLAYADQHGIDVNRRLGENRLRKAIAEAPLPPAVTAD